MYNVCIDKRNKTKNSFHGRKKIFVFDKKEAYNTVFNNACFPTRHNLRFED